MTDDLKHEFVVETTEQLMNICQRTTTAANILYAQGREHEAQTMMRMNFSASRILMDYWADKSVHLFLAASEELLDEIDNEGKL